MKVFWDTDVHVLIPHGEHRKRSWLVGHWASGTKPTLGNSQ